MAICPGIEHFQSFKSSVLAFQMAYVRKCNRGDLCDNPVFAYIQLEYALLFQLVNPC